ncbi:MAG: hypothetical protein HY231_13835 [Acidobacteria bacterium]|nr:hypothetical protein [Acidobacteriota bacterium]
MIKFEIKTTGLLIGRPSEFEHLLRKNISIAENRTIRTARDLARKPIPDGTAKIRTSIKVIPSTIGKLETSVRTQHPLMQYVEEPTRPHIIRPKNKKALAFTIKGKHYVVKEVHHPGTKGKHSFEQAWRYFQENFEPVISNAITAAFAGKVFNKS